MGEDDVDGSASESDVEAGAEAEAEADAQQEHEDCDDDGIAAGVAKENTPVCARGGNHELNLDTQATCTGSAGTGTSAPRLTRPPLDAAAGHNGAPKDRRRRPRPC